MYTYPEYNLCNQMCNLDKAHNISKFFNDSDVHSFHTE